DYSARQAELGKAVGDDFRDGKVTLPVLLAFARGDDEEQGFWRRTIEAMEQRPGDLERAILLVERRGALAETLARARSYAANAIDALSLFDDSLTRRALAEAALFAIDRTA
ncbi:MAG: polyprenyl synthetase family protein, partial [Stellaceae bacterium]